ncbi:DEAD-box ATP-dependent RNA helicase 7 [Artemisia annua]|uniref:DEAD-box ATP-dependent RNA helicase 7 n=1 Tax=Artemisia annua TaxID=35608 RepID=A0A2U1NTZ7_ARTAN|nr:DEAD-box ATP-dependent RNA helicase 7 [Artemisia annua]
MDRGYLRCTLFFPLLTAINFLPLYCEPPRDIEDYIHRSGGQEEQREVGVKLEHVPAPQRLDIAIAGLDAAEAIQQVSDRHDLFL